MREDYVRCNSCHRTPVPGEFIHRLESDRVVCSLCLGKVRAPQRDRAVEERVHAGERHLAVVPRAA
jgi:hypothetical protein